MMANPDAKDGPMFSDWLSSLRQRTVSDTVALAPNSTDTATVQSLATGVQQLCALCEDLLTLVSCWDAPDEARPLLDTLPEQLEAVRASAAEIKYQDASGAPADDSYSLAALDRWVWRE